MQKSSIVITLTAWHAGCPGHFSIHKNHDSELMEMPFRAKVVFSAGVRDRVHAIIATKWLPPQDDISIDVGSYSLEAPD